MLRKYFIIVVLIGSVMSLRSSDLCNIVQKECYGHRDSQNNYEIKCVNIKCSVTHSFKCGQDKCSINQKECESYQHFTLVLNSYRYKSDMDKYAMFSPNLKLKISTEKNKLSLFHENILNCPLKNYSLKLEDICLNGKSCYEKRVIFKGFGFNYSMRRIICTCSGVYNYQCGNDHCTIHKSACDKLKIQLIQHPIMGLKECGNNDTSIHRKSSLFW